MIPDFPPIRISPQGAPGRETIRAFLDERLDSSPAAERARSWSACDARFSEELGKQGWIGLTWPEKFGGKAASHLVRYRIVEELLAAGAPVAAHWFADRQSGTMLLRYASERQKARLLPRMAAGELYFCIGMSEPDSGSDLASLRTGARRDGENWRVTGSKIWTSHAQHAHYMIALVRTGSDESDRRAGLSQLIIDLSSPGVTIRPIEDQTGDAHFCEVFLDDVLVPADMLLGEPGNGWAQVNAELALERSGPERFLSSHV
ncbi:MAG: acyl-CoA dehydrogenase family protein, partial [Parasphingopyxis sp.]